MEYMLGNCIGNNGGPVKCDATCGGACGACSAFEDST